VPQLLDERAQRPRAAGARGQGAEKCRQVAVSTHALFRLLRCAFKAVRACVAAAGAGAPRPRT
jgi:hypothetical protein